MAIGILALLLLVLIWTWFIPEKWKNRKPKKKPLAEQLTKDWHHGKHFGTVFWNPYLRCNCVILHVVDRDHWYFASEKEPTLYQKSAIPITKIARELK